MAESVSIVVDGKAILAERGQTVAVALLNNGIAVMRTSPGGQGRGPLCGMGVCYECRVTVDGVAHKRACMELCESGMVVTTDG